MKLKHWILALALITIGTNIAEATVYALVFPICTDTNAAGSWRSNCCITVLSPITMTIFENDLQGNTIVQKDYTFTKGSATYVFRPKDLTSTKQSFQGSIWIETQSLSYDPWLTGVLTTASNNNQMSQAYSATKYEFGVAQPQISELIRLAKAGHEIDVMARSLF